MCIVDVVTAVAIAFMSFAYFFVFVDEALINIAIGFFAIVHIYMCVC